MADPQAPQHVTPSASAMCTDCVASMPAVTKHVVMALAAGALLGVVGLDDVFDNCPGAILSSYGLQFYRLVFSTWVGPLMSGLFGCLLFFQMGSQVENKRGSVHFLYSVLFLALAIQLAFFLLIAMGSLLFPYHTHAAAAGTVPQAAAAAASTGVAAMPQFSTEPIGSTPSSSSSSRPSSSSSSSSSGRGGIAVDPNDAHNSSGAVFFRHACSTGCWPLLFALMMLEAACSAVPTRRLCCFPWDIPVRYYPLALMTVFALLPGSGFQLSWPLGAAVGFVYAFHGEGRAADGRFRLQPTEQQLRDWEASERLAPLISHPRFIAMEAAGTVPPWTPFGPAQAPPPGAFAASGGGGGGGGARGNIHGMGSGPSAPSNYSSNSGAGPPSVFAGKGYSLSGGSSSSSSSGGGSAASSSQRSAREAAATALEARLRKEGGGDAASSSSSSSSGSSSSSSGGGGGGGGDEETPAAETDSLLPV